MNNRLFCAIPARAGSTRLPRKNILPMNGKPMIAYSIDAARASDLFDEVYVCTEDETIAEIAVRYGATVPQLVPQEQCGDMVASHVPCQHIASALEKDGVPIDTLVCLQPTSPLRTSQDIKEAVTRFIETDVDFLVSVTPVDPHYFHWALASDESGNWGMYFGEQYLKERPLLPPVYRPNGSIKIASLEKLREVNHFFGSNLSIVEIPEERSVHVATQFDFDLCSFLLSRGGE